MNAPATTFPNLRLARLDDYPAIYRLEREYFPDTLSRDDWTALYLNNPLWPRLGSSWPIGWILDDDAGQIVAAFTNVPALYHFRGEELLCANGHRWVAVPEYRSYSLVLMVEHHSQPGVDLLINTTVGDIATPVLSMLAERVPVGDWHTRSYRVTRHLSFCRKTLAIRRVPLGSALAVPLAAGLWCADSVSPKPPRRPRRSLDIAHAEMFDERFDAFWAELRRRNHGKLLAARDAATLNWHYASLIRAGQLRILTASRNNLLRGFCVLKQQNYRLGLRSIKLIDYQSVADDEDLLPDFIAAALAWGATDGAHCLEYAGRDQPKLASLDRLARLRIPKTAWSFYYKATDPALAAELTNPDVWDPSDYDGDASWLPTSLHGRPLL